ncbi:hypothetical protein RhiirA4_398295, partial [Rhizophagus irregularis]
MTHIITKVMGDKIDNFSYQYDGNEQDEPHINSEFDDFSRRRKIVQIMFRASIRSGICVKIKEFDNWKI